MNSILPHKPSLHLLINCSGSVSMHVWVRGRPQRKVNQIKYKDLHYYLLKIWWGAFLSFKRWQQNNNWKRIKIKSFWSEGKKGKRKVKKMDQFHLLPIKTISLLCSPGCCWYFVTSSYVRSSAASAWSACFASLGLFSFSLRLNLKLLRKPAVEKKQKRHWTTSPFIFMVKLVQLEGTVLK